MTTWPAELTTKQINFDIRGAGTIQFTGPVLTVAVDNGITLRVNEMATTSTGTGSITLPCTDASAAVPSGWEYAVTIRRGGKVDRGTMTLLSAASSPVTLASVLQLDQNTPAAGTTYIPLTQKGAASGVASLGVDGKVPSGQLPSGSGGSIASTDITDSTATGRAVLTAATAAAARSAIGAGTGSSNLALGTTAGTAYAGDSGAALEARVIDPAFPLSHWGLVAASGDPTAFTNPSQVTAQDWMARTWIPAGKPIAGLYLAIAAAGTHDGVISGNGLAIFTDAGALVDTIAYTDSLWATAGWRGGNLLGGTIAAQSAGRWVYLAAKVRGYASSPPSFAFVTGANDRAYMYTGPGTTKRRTFYTSAAATFPSTIDGTSTGTATGYNFLIGAA